MQCTRCFQIRQFLAESVRQSRESANGHSHREILPFHKACRDVVRMRIASSDFGYNLHDRTWGVPRIGVMLAVVAEQLHKLRKVQTLPENRALSPDILIVFIVANDLSASGKVIRNGD